MIEEVVRVTRIENDDVWVEADRLSACAACTAKKGCGQGALSEWMSDKSIELTVANPAHLVPSVGQAVVVGLEEGSLIRASLLVYLVPLLSLVALAIIARSAGGSEGVQILAGTFGLALGFMAVRWFSRRQASKGSSECYQPILLRLV